VLLFYVDDTGENGNTGFSALGIPATSWKAAYGSLLDFRRKLCSEHNIPVGCELHATEFIGGRGTAGRALRDWGKRLEVFEKVLDLADGIPGATLVSAFDKAIHEDRLFERLMTRINNCAVNCTCHAIVISDEGKNARFRALARKLGKYNPIPSRFGGWAGAGPTKNIPTDAILEDIIFRPSDGCRFVQLVDFCAYALLRYEIPHATRPALSDSFNRLKTIVNVKAFGKDPRHKGIIRGT
jgi:hypothetical protein